MSEKKWGLTLGGGAAKGIAHIGVIKCFQENQIMPDVIVGNSIGSMAGAFYAYGFEWKDMLDTIKNDVPKNILFNRYKFLYNSRYIELYVEKLIGKCKFDTLKTPLACVTCDVRTGEQVVLKEGKVSRAVRASCCIPGVFNPTPMGKKLLVDGCIVNSIPADVCRDMGAEFVVSVDLNADSRKGTDSESFIEILLASIHIMIGYNAKKGLEQSDVIIEPDMHNAPFHKLEDIDKWVSEGEKAANKMLPKIKNFLES